MRRIWPYSLIAVACLAVAGLLTAGIVSALSQRDESRLEQASTPTVSETPEPAPETTAEETEEQTREETGEKGEKQDESGQEGQDRPRKDESRKASAGRQSEPQQPVQPAVPASDALSLTVPSIGIQNDPVTNSISESVLANGAGKLPQTGFPWQPGSNTYIAAHVYGYPGTGSWQQFADLPSMSKGDEIFLTDSNGTVYEYRVNEILTVSPTDVWVARPTGQTSVSLQTCVGPGWSERLVVRGNLVDTRAA